MSKQLFLSTIRAARKIKKLHLKRLHSFDWGREDHAHICIVARLLEYDDFKQVCPLAENSHKYVERCEVCDRCEYYSIVEFNEAPQGKKSIDLL